MKIQFHLSLCRSCEGFAATLLALALALPGFAWGAGPANPSLPGSPPVFHSNRILVKPKNAAKLAADPLAPVHLLTGARVLRSFATIGGLQVVELSGVADVKSVIDFYRKSGAVEYAEPDYQVHLATTPNDPQYVSGVLWALNNFGQDSGVNDADMDAPEGWSLRHDAPNIIVAVIDTGIRYTHEDLAANMWTNPTEIPGNGVDDDGDGFVDDVHGINAIAHSGDSNDDNGHGTHVAGIIGAVGNNALGVVGVAWNVRLMACKFINAAGYGYVSDAITCIDYARSHGAKVMNNSWGGGGYSQALQDAIDTAGRAGIIFVAAAGNSSSDNDALPFYPASYGSDNLVAVAATTRTDDLAYFSSFGQDSVAIGAPGLDITSTWNASDQAYTTLSGTSMATPEVSGVFALMAAQFPQESYLELFNRVYGSVDPLSALAGKCRTGGRINLARALASASSRPGNDAFANRMSLTSGSFHLRGLNIDATKEPGEPNHAGNAGGKSIWWSWRPPAAGIATVTTLGSSFNTLLAVYTGASVSALPLVAANDDDPGGGTTCSSVTFEAFAGTDYAIAVDGFDGAAGTVELSTTFAPRPANDNFTNRLAIPTSMPTVTGSNTLATSEVSEPLHAGQPGGKSVWWSWTAAASETATITTAGSDFNTLLAVYTGTVLSNLSLVAANDDAPGGGTTTSLVSFPASAGTTYQIAVDGFNGANGDITLNTPPFNDHFTNALPLSGLSASATGCNLLATRDPFEPNHAPNASGRSVWWNWKAPSSGTASVTTIGSSFDTVVAVYTGSTLGSLTLVAANDNDPYGNFTSLASFSAIAGTTYRIAVDGINGACGIVRVQAIMGSQYVITDIGTMPGYTHSGAYSINNLGTVAGTVIGAAPQYTHHACIWTSSGGMQPLMSGDTESEAMDINDFNQVVGYLRRPGYSSIAFLWQNGVVRELGGLSSHPRSEAYAIDNVGRVVGWTYTDSGYFHAFVWQDGVMTDLGALGNDRSAAYGLNGRDFVVGSGGDSSASTQWPDIWQRGSLSRLPVPPGGTTACALSVNSLFQVVGSFQGPSVLHAILWEDGNPIDLGGGPSGVTEANSINNLGRIVGDAQFGGLLYEGGQWKDLLSLVPAGSGWGSLFMAYKINDHGQIAGAGSPVGDPSGARGYVLTPLTPVTPRAIILSPTNHQTFFASADIPITILLVPDASNLSKVDCFHGGELIGTSTNASYGTTWNNVPPGDYVLSACTTSRSGATATSKSVAISVLPRPTLSLAPDSRSVTLSWPLSPGNFVLESASNLAPATLWLSVTDAIFNLNGTNWSTINAANDRRFFRLRGL